MQDIFPQTAARLAQWREQPDVLGILLVGSKSRAYNDALSDDDLEILLADEDFAQRTPSECAEFAFEGEGDARKLIYDTQYTTLTALQQKLSSPLDLDHWPYERACILFDRNGHVAPVVTEKDLYCHKLLPESILYKLFLWRKVYANSPLVAT